MLLEIRTRKEEENLIAGFGDDYRNYMQRTGRFLPRPRALAHGKHVYDGTQRKRLRQRWAEGWNFVGVQRQPFSA